MIRRYFSCCLRSSNKGVYVLQLRNGKIYVGESNNISERIHSHTQKRGSSWTKKHWVVRRLPLKTKSHEGFSELAETLEWMKEKGIENVRGSLFTKPYPLNDNEKIMAAQLYCELHNLCRKCGGKGHFVTQCQRDDVDHWVNQFGGRLQQPCIPQTKPDTSRKCLSCDVSIQNLPSNFRYCRPCFYKTMVKKP